MALQGTLDTFELPDVLRLLASTKKTGRLLLHGDRGEGSVWLADGQVDGGPDRRRRRTATRATACSTCSGPAKAASPSSPAWRRTRRARPTTSSRCSTPTERRLAEWREIEAVVPSLHAWVRWCPELPAPEVTVDAATWRLVATIGSGITVGDLGRSLDLARGGRVPRRAATWSCSASVRSPTPRRWPRRPAPIPAATWEPTVADPAPAINGHGFDRLRLRLRRAGPATSRRSTTCRPSASTPSRPPAPAAPGTTSSRRSPRRRCSPSRSPPPSEPDRWRPEPTVDEALRRRRRRRGRPPARHAEPPGRPGGRGRGGGRHRGRARRPLDALDDSDEPINRGLLLKFLELGQGLSRTPLGYGPAPVDGVAVPSPRPSGRGRRLPEWARRPTASPPPVRRGHRRLRPRGRRPGASHPPTTPRQRLVLAAPRRGRARRARHPVQLRRRSSPTSASCCSGYLAAMVVDLQYLRLPNVFTYPAAVFAVAGAYRAVGRGTTCPSSAPGSAPSATPGSSSWSGSATGCSGAGRAWASGDVKLALSLGASAGWLGGGP